MDTVAMEISSSTPLTDLERNALISRHSQEVVQYPEVHLGKEDAEGEYGKGNEDECDYLVFEIGELKGKEEEADSKSQDRRGGELEREELEEKEQVDTEEGHKENEDEMDDWRRTEVEGEDEWQRTEEQTETEDRGGDTKAEDEWTEETVGEMKDDALSELLCISDGPLCSASSQPHFLTSNPSEQPEVAMWLHDDGSRGDLCNSHLNDCLRAELAIVYSDSDAGEDQWSAYAPSDVTNREEADEGMQDGKCDGEERQREDEEKQEDCETDVVIGTEEQTLEGREQNREGRADDDEEHVKTRRSHFLRSPSASSTASSTDPDRKLPVDFCVHQEIHSENVSTEHVDFLLARQQWKKMEEGVKGRPTPKPGLVVQGSFQGTHTSLYPPTRSPRLKRREIHPSDSREPPLSSTLSPSSEDSGLDDLLCRSPLEEPESAVEREIRLTLEREEKHRRERGMIAQGLAIPRPSTLHTGRSPPRPPACRTPTLSISPSPSCSSSLPRSLYHEMTANNVIILEPDSSSSTSRNRLLSSAIGGLSNWPASLDEAPSTNVIVVETSNLIIRSASEFCLSSPPASVETQESTFSSNPFFKLRSLSSQSLVEQEIRMVRQREEEWRRQREEMWRRRREEEWRRGRERYDTVLVSPSLSENISCSVPVVPDRCVSSPSSPSRTRKIERSSLSCDHKFPPSLSSVPRRQNAMVQRWEASLLANQKKD